MENRNQTDVKLSRMNKNHRLTKRAFTLIELIVVIAVIAILVLLAMSRFAGYSEKAKTTQVVNDIKVLEGRIEEYLLRHESFPDAVTEGLVSSGQLYDRTGKITATPSGLKVIGETFYPESNLSGTFFTNDKANVIYEDNSALVGGGTPPVVCIAVPEGYTLAGDDDFTFYASEYAVNEYLIGGILTKGYFGYSGTDKLVSVPSTINGNEIKDYYLMFSSTLVEGVASCNPNVTSMKHMFMMNKAPTMDLSNFDTSAVTDMDGMFYGTNAVDVGGFDTSNVTNMEIMFQLSKAPTIDVSNFDTSKVSTMGGMFNDAKFVTILDVSNFDTSNTVEMTGMFNGIESVNSLDVSNFDTSKVTGMSGMFMNTILTEIDISGFDTSNVERMSNMFKWSAVTDLNFSNFNTSKVTKMDYMFDGAVVEPIDLSSFNTSNVTTMESMFNRTTSVTIDVSNFNTANVTNMNNMFYYTYFLELDLSSFDTSNVTNTLGMLDYCDVVVGYARTQADADKLNNRSETGLHYTVSFTVK